MMLGILESIKKFNVVKVWHCFGVFGDAGNLENL